MDTEVVAANDSSVPIIDQSMQDEIRVYLVVNTDLKMSLGKTAVQVGHAVQYLLDHRDKVLAKVDHQWGAWKVDSSLSDLACRFNSWKESSSRCKIALAANTEQFNRIKTEYAGACVVVRDAGRTEIPSGSETVIGLYPMKKSERNETLKGLKLL
jgi:PTH2 family peptidyl-tRNA hydrolase